MTDLPKDVLVAKRVRVLTQIDIILAQEGYVDKPLLNALLTQLADLEGAITAADDFDLEMPLDGC